MPRLFLYFLLFSLGLIPLVGWALSHPPDLTGAGQDERGFIREKRDAPKQEVQKKRDAVKEGFQQKRQEVKQDIETRRQEIKGKREAFHQEVKEKREVLFTELKDKRSKFREEVKVRKEELKKKLGEKKAERIEAFFQKMVEKFEAAIARLRGFAERIASRLDRAGENGKDVVLLRSKLVVAEEKLSAAERALEGAKTKYNEIAQGSDFRVSFSKVREVVRIVSLKVKEAHRALVDVVRSIKGLELGGGNATTTSATSTP